MHESYTIMQVYRFKKKKASILGGLSIGTFDRTHGVALKYIVFYNYVTLGHNLQI